MKKEILIAIVIGIIFGLVVTGGYLFYQRVNQPVAVEPFNPLIEDYPAQNGSRIKFADNSAHSINLISPLDNLLTNQSKANISGITSPESWLVILFEKNETVIKADIEGSFDTTITLIGGENEITIRSFSPSGLISEKTVTVVYSTVEI